jgi:arginine-glutamic acid dipeptide repeat-containing protein
MSKRDTLNVHIKWFYRTNEVPEQVYQVLIQDRHTEHKTFHKAQVLAEKAASEHLPSNGEVKKSKRPRLDDRMLRMRELFVSEATDVYPVSVLRGKCNVSHCQDIKAVKDFEATADTFFYTLSYNPETRRLASTQGEIRVGASHQVILSTLQILHPDFIHFYLFKGHSSRLYS